MKLLLPHMKLIPFFHVGNCDEVARGVLTFVKVPNSDVAELGDEDAPAVEFVIRVQFSYVLFSIVTREVSYSLIGFSKS